MRVGRPKCSTHECPAWIGLDAPKATVKACYSAFWPDVGIGLMQAVGAEELAWPVDNVAERVAAHIIGEAPKH